jgi:hypothetical protein
VKVWGTGLYEDLRQIEVTKQKSPYSSPKRIIENHHITKEWCIEYFDPSAQHFGAVYFESKHANLNLIGKITNKNYHF